MATIGTILALMHGWAGQPLPVSGSLRVDGPRWISRYRFWWMRPDRYRLEEVEGDQPRTVTVRRDREMWWMRGHRVSHRRKVAGTLSVLDNLLMSPLGELEDAPPALQGTTRVAGRQFGKWAEAARRLRSPFGSAACLDGLAGAPYVGY